MQQKYFGFGCLAFSIWLFTLSSQQRASKSAHENAKYFIDSRLPEELFLRCKILSGDIIFRLGHGFISEALRTLSQRDQHYSHAGIISVENGMPYVYHLIGGESEASTIRREKLEDFCKPENAKSFAVYRILSDDLQRNIIDSLNHYYYHCTLPFDNRFDMNTDSAMYCTEYVYKVISQANDHNILITSSVLSGFRYISCDDIYLNSSVQKIFEYQYIQN